MKTLLSRKLSLVFLIVQFLISAALIGVAFYVGFIPLKFIVLLIVVCLFLLWIFINCSCKSSLFISSIEDNGSSKSNTLGSNIVALNIDIIRCIPPDNSLIIKRTNAQSFVAFRAVTASLFRGRPRICRLCHMAASTEEHPPNLR